MSRALARALPATRDFCATRARSEARLRWLPRSVTWPTERPVRRCVWASWWAALLRRSRALSRWSRRASRWTERRPPRRDSARSRSISPERWCSAWRPRPARAAWRSEWRTARAPFRAERRLSCRRLARRTACAPRRVCRTSAAAPAARPLRTACMLRAMPRRPLAAWSTDLDTRRRRALNRSSRAWALTVWRAERCRRRSMRSRLARRRTPRMKAASRRAVALAC
mmetsp:Transcript_23079/g.50194  ORF Transcript_23079/g.50194 Transcript_23079/m.50194 type:complete len:226 (-) Transcript_23079:1617-2294(-)